jgi:hypothetical protein
MSLVKEGEHGLYFQLKMWEENPRKDCIEDPVLNSNFGFEKFVHTKTVKGRRGGKREVFRHSQHCFE